jgi:hypothetical protein
MFPNSHLHSLHLSTERLLRSDTHVLYSTHNDATYAAPATPTFTPTCLSYLLSTTPSTCSLHSDGHSTVSHRAPPPGRGRKCVCLPRLTPTTAPTPTEDPAIAALSGLLGYLRASIAKPAPPDPLNAALASMQATQAEQGAALASLTATIASLTAMGSQKDRTQTTEIGILKAQLERARVQGEAPPGTKPAVPVARPDAKPATARTPGTSGSGESAPTHPTSGGSLIVRVEGVGPLRSSETKGKRTTHIYAMTAQPAASSQASAAAPTTKHPFVDALLRSFNSS